MTAETEAATSGIESTALFVFAKPPRSPLSKTRLAALVGAEHAAELASLRLAATTLDAASYGLPPTTRMTHQGEGDLGERMERVLRAGLDDCESVLLVGADCPGVGRPQFEAATRALITHDAYLAPTLDGGFYLVGVRRIAPDLFGGVTFSVASACAATAARFEALGLRVAHH